MAKEEGLDRRSRYYQTIAKVFIELRGAPFFLSPKEVDMVKQWEEKEIPLRVVLEGIKGSFERHRIRQGIRHKPYSLDYCNTFVERAFDLYRDRRVGRKNEKVSRGKKWETRLLREIETFLANDPEELHALRPLYQALRGKLLRGEASEEELERTEEAIERVIEKSLSATQMKTITQEIGAEFGKIPGAQFGEIFRIKALKTMREKHKIPHVSPFYY
jgi:hypothetical protein